MKLMKRRFAVNTTDPDAAEGWRSSLSAPNCEVGIQAWNEAHLADSIGCTVWDKGCMIWVSPGNNVGMPETVTANRTTAS